MSMTAAFLTANRTPLEPETGKEYRVIGFHIAGAKYTVERIEKGMVYFKGYVLGKELLKLYFYPVEN